jgi:hypothetical protein
MADMEDNVPQGKSSFLVELAKRLNLKIINVPVSKTFDAMGFIGQDILVDREAYNEAEDARVESMILAEGTLSPEDFGPLVSRFIHIELKPDFDLFLNPRTIKVGDTVLMEYAQDVVETVLVDVIEDGFVYGTGDDGEPYCAPLSRCDKVPF